MIYISIEGQSPPQAWLDKARRITRELEDAEDEAARNSIIDKNQSLWKELKGWLLSLSYGKCWFSEARDLYSHFDVEHFRPKKRTKNIDGGEREGYWWLAFDWQNLRICGNVGNRKKGSFFPLRAGHCATSENRNVDDELCYLLDPRDRRDPDLLSFNELGEAIPTPSCGKWERERVEESIRLFKFNEHQPLVEARRELWDRCRQRISECENLLLEYNRQPSIKKKAIITEKITRLRDMVKPSAVLSATAAECFRTSNIEWAQRIAVGN
jgi:uncharacterized protein (TIGR02646 family)